MAAISRRGQGGRIYNNTRTREPLRRMCVKPAALTTHSSPKTCSRPSTFSLPSRTLPLPHAAPTHTRRLRHAFLADLTTHFPPKTCSRPRSDAPFPSIFSPPSRTLPLPHAAPTHVRKLRHAFLADLTTHSSPKACSRPRTATRPPRTDARPLAAPTHIPHRRPSPVPAAPRCLPFRSASGTKKRHRTVDVRCRMSRSTVVAVGHWGL